MKTALNTNVLAAQRPTLKPQPWPVTSRETMKSTHPSSVQLGNVKRDFCIRDCWTSTWKFMKEMENACAMVAEKYSMLDISWFFTQKSM